MAALYSDTSSDQRGELVLKHGFRGAEVMRTRYGQAAIHGKGELAGVDIAGAVITRSVKASVYVVVGLKGPLDGDEPKNVAGYLAKRYGESLSPDFFHHGNKGGAVLFLEVSEGGRRRAKSIVSELKAAYQEPSPSASARTFAWLSGMARSSRLAALRKA